MTDTKNAQGENSEERDGRRRRRVESRRAITEAMMSLIEEGNMDPTAAQVSQRANVGMRTVFRHFNDMETLFAETTDVLTERVSHYFTYVSDAKDLDARLRDVIDQRAELFQVLANFKQSTQAWFHKSEYLRDDDLRTRKLLHNNLKQNFPEMKDLPEPQRKALDLALGFDGWLGNRVGGRLTVAQTKDVIYALAKPQFNV